MTPGEVAVVAVRGRQLVDALALYVSRRRAIGEPTEWVGRAVLRDVESDVVWQAQRVRSAATKALGTRIR
jgi:hypothetical protein